MRVGEIAERAGVNVETLRYYERRGLLPTPHRDPSGHRRYDEDTVRLLHAIKEAQAVGFLLTEIGEYLRASRRSTSPSEALRVRMATKIDELDQRVAALRRMRDELARVVGCACDSLDHCTCGAAYLARSGREAAAPPTVLHVTNGESAANTLRRTALGGAVLPWQDVLHAGPVPAVPRPELRRRRAAFLSECGWGSRQAILASLAGRDHQLERAFAERVPVVLWFEHDLYDQLQLVDVLALAGAAGAAPEAIVVDSFPGKPGFRGLGELTAEELETLWPVRREFAERDRALAAGAAEDEVVLWFEHDLYDQLQLIQLLDWFADHPHPRLTLVNPPEYLGSITVERARALFDARAPVTAAQLALGRRAWDAFRGPDPRQVEEVMYAADAGALPHLADALLRLLQELPDAVTGLSRSETQILEAFAEGPRALGDAYPASHQDREDAIWLGDAPWVDYVDRLAHGAAPLLEYLDPREGTGIPAVMRRRARITDAGREVLAGRSDAVWLNGIDRWMGGVHLQGREVPWRWDVEEGRIVEERIDEDDAADDG